MWLKFSLRILNIKAMQKLRVYKIERCREGGRVILDNDMVQAHGKDSGFTVLYRLHVKQLSYSCDIIRRLHTIKHVFNLSQALFAPSPTSLCQLTSHVYLSGRSSAMSYMKGFPDTLPFNENNHFKILWLLIYVCHLNGLLAPLLQGNCPFISAQPTSNPDFAMVYAQKCSHRRYLLQFNAEPQSHSVNLITLLAAVDFRKLFNLFGFQFSKEKNNKIQRCSTLSMVSHTISIL